MNSKMDLDALRSAVWALVGGDDLDRGGCWCRNRDYYHEPECERVRAIFRANPMPAPRRDFGPQNQVGYCTDQQQQRAGEGEGR